MFIMNRALKLSFSFISMRLSSTNSERKCFNYNLRSIPRNCGAMAGVLKLMLSSFYNETINKDEHIESIGSIFFIKFI